MSKELHIETYVLRKGVYDFDDLEANPFDYYVSIKHKPKEAANIIKNIVKNTEDNIYDIDGLIHISYKYKEVIPITYWDEINCLWPYLLNVTEEYLDEGSATYYFPNSSIPIDLYKYPNGRIRFSVDKAFIIVDERYFIRTLTDKAKEFFDFVDPIVGPSYNAYHREQIKKILDQLN